MIPVWVQFNTFGNPCQKPDLFNQFAFILPHSPHPLLRFLHLKASNYLVERGLRQIKQPFILLFSRYLTNHRLHCSPLHSFILVWKDQFCSSPPLLSPSFIAEKCQSWYEALRLKHCFQFFPNERAAVPHLRGRSNGPIIDMDSLSWFYGCGKLPGCFSRIESALWSLQ